jgi:hypothetical protein
VSIIVSTGWENAEREGSDACGSVARNEWDKWTMGSDKGAKPKAVMIAP